MKEKKTILVADDDIEARELLKVLLSADYRVVEAKDGVSLVEKAKAVEPDLIITDVVMPGLGGWKAIKKIREVSFLKNIPVIFYSSLLKDRELYHIYKPSGHSIFIYKPYEKQEMLKLIKKMLGE